MNWYRIECFECGINVELFMSFNHEVLCKEHFGERLEKISKIKAHLEKKETLDERLDFLTCYGLRFEEVFSICEEIRSEIVSETERNQKHEKLRNNNKCKNKTPSNENTGVDLK